MAGPVTDSVPRPDAFARGQTLHKKKKAGEEMTWRLPSPAVGLRIRALGFKLAVGPE